MGVITSIRQNKHNKERCSVFVDEEYLAACPIDVALGLELKKGMEMTPELEEELRRQDHVIVLKQKAYRYATYKTRTQKQVADALIRYGASEQECASILEWLQEFHLINDEGYAESFIESSIARKPLSARDAKRRLSSKGIQSDLADRVIEAAYNDDVELHAATRVAVKKLGMIRGTSNEKKQKLIRFLQYRQYSWQTIQRVLESLSAELLVLAMMVFCVANAHGQSPTMPNECEKERLPESINSFQPTTLPVLAPDGDLFLDRKLHPENRDGITDPDDVWIATPRSTVAWSEPIQRDISTFRSPDILFNFTFDGRDALVVGKYRVQSGDSVACFALAHRDQPDERFTSVEVVDIPGMPDLSSNFYGFLANDLKTMLVAIEAPGGTGDLDIYVSSRCSGSWSALKSVGSKINTTSLEGAPWLAADDKTLYFASSGRDDRRGKADLYVSRRLDSTWTNWSEPVSLGSCINTPEDETAVSLVGRGDTVLFTSWDSHAQRAGVYTATLPQELRPSPVCKLILDVRDANTGSIPLRPISAQIVSSDHSQCGGVYSRGAMDNGQVHAILHENHSYEVTTSCAGYLDHSQQVRVQKLDSTVELRINVELFPSDLPIFSVYFDRGESKLSASQRARLDSALAVYDVRNLSFSVSGYTDGLGTEMLNKTLSQRRAATVRDELLRYGIPEKRIIARGRGIETQATLGFEAPELRRVDIYPSAIDSD